MTHDGTAKVVSCEFRPHGWSKTDSSGRSTTVFDLILDVFPDDAAPFRAEAEAWFSEIRFPDEGDSLKVRCNPERKKVEVDLSEDMRFNPKLFRPANDAQRKRDHELTLNAPPGTPPVGREVDDPDLAELKRLVDEESAQQDR